MYSIMDIGIVQMLIKDPLQAINSQDAFINMTAVAMRNKLTNFGLQWNESPLVFSSTECHRLLVPEP